MKRKVHLKGRLKRYVQWPILMSILLLVMNLCMYPISVKAGVAMSVFVLVYIVIVTVLYVQNRAQIYGELVSFATQYGQIQRKLLKELAIPYVLLSEDGRIVWSNREFNRITGKIGKFNKAINTVFPELNQGRLPTEEEPGVSVNLKYG